MGGKTLETELIPACQLARHCKTISVSQNFYISLSLCLQPLVLFDRTALHIIYGFVIIANSWQLSSFINNNQTDDFDSQLVESKLNNHPIYCICLQQTFSPTQWAIVSRVQQNCLLLLLLLWLPLLTSCLVWPCILFHFDPL